MAVQPLTPRARPVKPVRLRPAGPSVVPAAGALVERVLGDALPLESRIVVRGPQNLAAGIADAIVVVVAAEPYTLPRLGLPSSSVGVQGR